MANELNRWQLQFLELQRLFEAENVSPQVAAILAVGYLCEERLAKIEEALNQMAHNG
jgi:hypothetical protein